MTIAECRELKKGEKLYINLGNGWYQEVTFIRMTEITSFGKMTLDDLINNRVDFRHGKVEQRALCEYIDNRGRKQEYGFSPRKLHRR